MLLYHYAFKDGDGAVHTVLERELSAQGFPAYIKVEGGASHIETAKLDDTLQPSQLYEYHHEEACRRAIRWITKKRRGKRTYTVAKQEQPLRALFLLGLCCAQRTRYPSLLLSTALHPASKSDQAEDLRKRSETVGEWIESLAAELVVRFLPGGFVWLHAKVKELLRKELGIPSPGDINAWKNYEVPEIWTNFDSHIPHRTAIFRAHSLLARWYERLFLSSGDPLAGLEVVFHYLEAAKCAAVACRDSASTRRRPMQTLDASLSDHPWDQLVDSLSAASDMLERVRPEAYSSGYPKASCRRLVYLRCTSVRQLYTLVTKISIKNITSLLQLSRNNASVSKKDVLDSLDRMVMQMLRTKRGIGREVSEHTRAFQRHRQLLEYYVRGTTKETRPLPFTNDDFLAQHHQVAELKHTLNKGELQGAGREHNPDEIRRFLSDWQRHSGILGIASRAYEFSGHMICRALQQSIGGEVSSRHKSLREKVIKLIRKKSGANELEPKQVVDFATSEDGMQLREAMLQELCDDVKTVLDELEERNVTPRKGTIFLPSALKCLCRVVQWLVVVVESLHFSKRCEGIWSSEDSYERVRHSLLRYAERAFALFNRMVHRLPASEGQLYRQVRQTMETQMATVFGLNEMFPRAHRCLEAAIELRPQREPSMTALSAGVVELHRAQLFLVHAQYVKGEKGEEKPLIPLVREAVASTEGRVGNRIPPPDDLDLLIQRFGLAARADNPRTSRGRIKPVKTIERLINDAESALQKAEAILISKRKNVWWSTWLFELQIKAIEYRTLTGVYEACVNAAQRAKIRTKPKGEGMHAALRHVLRNPPKGVRQASSYGRPIRDFGSRACPRGQETRADEILGKTIRMVRLDLIRISRVVESYVLCFRGLRFLQSLAPELERLPSRLSMMHTILAGDSGSSGAIKVLEQRLERRTSMPPITDPFVVEYARYVVAFAKDCLPPSP